MRNLILLSILLFSINFNYSQTGKIDVNNMNITIHPKNVLFLNTDSIYTPYFETKNGFGQSTIFSTATWMFGEDATRQLKGNYDSGLDSSNFSTTTGPLTCNSGSGTGGLRDFGPANITQAEIAKWNKIFCVNKWEIDLFLRWHRSTNKAVDFPGYSIPTSITDWPAHGDVTLGQDYYLAPFYDNDVDGNYNPSSGDYPCIKGDNYCWYILNDKGNIHQTDPIGVEIHVEIYAFDKDSLNPLSNTIFVGKDIINRSTQTLFNFRVGQYSDLDIGCSSDDYVGSMQSLNAYYGYNADATDDNCSGGKMPYGINPPAQGVTFLNKTMNTSIYFENTSGNTGDPTNQVEAYRYINGKWKDGTQLNYGGNGYPSPIGTSTSGVNTNHVFPYLSSFAVAPWTEWSEGNPATDKRMVGSTSPITLNPGEVVEVDLAFVYSRNDSGNLSSVDKLYRDIQTVQQFYNDSIPSSCQAFILSKKELTLSQNDVALYPNPATNSITLENKTNENLNAEIFSIDGKLIISQFEINSNNKIDISRLNQGIYLIRVTNTKNQVIVKKLIKN